MILCWDFVAQFMGKRPNQEPPIRQGYLSLSHVMLWSGSSQSAIFVCWIRGLAILTACVQCWMNTLLAS